MGKSTTPCKLLLANPPPYEKMPNNTSLPSLLDFNPTTEVAEITEIDEEATDETTTTEAIEITTKETTTKVVWPTLTTRMLFQLLAPSRLVGQSLVSLVGC